MEFLIQYFETIASVHRSVILFGFLTLFLLIENGIPLFKFKYNRWKHLGLNLFFTFTTILVNFAMAFLLIESSEFAKTEGIGILNWTAMNPVATLIAGLFLLDLIGAYAALWVEHHVKWMWQFHVIHHTDQEVDASTANRHHPGESVIRFLFTLVAIITIGAPVWLIMLYQAMSSTLSQFNHSNLKMPKALDNALIWVFCTPIKHRVHHHYWQPYSDSNYGNIFHFWDRVFGTFKRVDNSKLIYGVDTYMDPEVVRDPIALLNIPFLGHRTHLPYDKKEILSS